LVVKFFNGTGVYPAAMYPNAMYPNAMYPNAMAFGRDPPPAKTAAGRP
jgi:hypothetical protein